MNRPETHPLKALCCALFIVMGAACTSALAAIEVQFWHAMAGPSGERVEALATRFNAQQNDYRVVPVFKGTYDETLAAGIAAWRAKKPPHLLQVDAGDAVAMTAIKGMIRPLHDVMSQANPKWDAHQFIPLIAAHYSDRHGKMLALPFNSSTPLFYFNNEVFNKAGIAAAPNTWREVLAAAIKVKDAGAACGFTTAWQSWVHLEAMSLWHNSEFATRANGFDGPDAQLHFNTIALVRHVSLLSSWVKGELFTYASRRDEAETRFVNGECAMLTSSSASYQSIRQDAKFGLGVARLPHHEEEPGSPFNASIGGAALWVMAGQKPAEYKGTAAFLEFVSSPVIAAQWHQETGFLPITDAAYRATKKGGFYEKNPGAETAIALIAGQKLSKTNRGIHLGNFALIRNILDEELESVWAGKKAPKQALDDAVKRGNERLRQFQATHKGTR